MLTAPEGTLGPDHLCEHSGLQLAEQLIGAIVCPFVTIYCFVEGESMTAAGPSVNKITYSIIPGYAQFVEFKKIIGSCSCR